MTVEPVQSQIDVTYEQFREEWLKEFTREDISSLEKGRNFAFKMAAQWLDINEDDEDLVVCDGKGDGGIDIAYLRRLEVDASDDTEQDSESVDGDIWYLFQGKYGSSFQGTDTIFKDGRKVISTLTGENTALSECSHQLVARLTTFRQQASERDRIILVFATDSPMVESDRQALNDLRSLGRERVGELFDVED